jgi:hypothetical protein
MATPQTTVTGLVTSEILHNKNCHAYLSKLKLPPSVLERIRVIDHTLAASLETVQRQTAYDPSFSYAALYTKFFTVVEGNIERIFDELNNKEERSDEENEQLADLDAFISSIYDNDNKILESTFEAIQHIPLSFGPVNPGIEGAITKHLRDKGTRINPRAQTPAEAGSAYGQASAFIGANFKPQHTTSIATVRTYDYKEQGHYVREYRFGTQSQRHERQARVSPLFERWLKVQARQHSMANADPTDASSPQATAKSDPPITHIYFNNLGLDPINSSVKNILERGRERSLTLELHTLEDRHTNVAVITLPADKGLMDRSAFKDTTPNQPYADVYKEFLDVASQNPDSTEKVKDFYISDKIRKRIFCDSLGNYSPEIEKAQIRILLNRSFEALGIRSEGAILSPAQKQAVWVHFIKFELPNHIIGRLNPQSVNFSCKDAIDRGGVSSCYFNLMKSIEAGNPMTRKEFERGLHAAPALVKARGMNSHSKLIWNAVDVYINAHYDEIRTDPKRAWLIEWRDLNCPHSRVNALLATRVRQVREELEAARDDLPEGDRKRHLIDLSLEMLERIGEQHEMGVSGKRLLLETVIRTPQVILHPEQGDLERYAELTLKLPVKYPTLQIIVGTMKAVLGAVLSFTSIGKEWHKAGLATAKAGWDAERRAAIRDYMQDLKAQVAEVRKPPSAQDEEQITDDTPRP